MLHQLSHTPPQTTAILENKRAAEIAIDSPVTLLKVVQKAPARRVEAGVEVSVYLLLTPRHTDDLPVEAEELHCLRQKQRPPVQTRRGVNKEESVVLSQEVKLNTLIDNGIDKCVWTSASLVW